MDRDHPSSKYSVTLIVWTVITLLLNTVVTLIVWMVITLLLQCDSHSVDGDHPSSTV